MLLLIALEPVRDVILDTEVWAWGKGCYGQLGLGDKLDRLQPCKIKQLSDKRILKLAAGARHTLALTVDCLVSISGIKVLDNL